MLACSGSQPADPGLVYDFAGSLSQAEIQREVGLIEFGTPEAHPHLVQGFSKVQRGRNGVSSVSALGERSLLRFFLTRPRAIEIELDCAPQRFPGLPPQEIVVRLNDQPAGRISLAKRRQVYRLSLPEHAAVAGSNTLEFSYPQRVQPDRDRLLAAGFPMRSIPPYPISVILYALRLGPGMGSQLQLGDAPATLPRVVRAESGTPELRIPYGTGLDYYLMAPAGATLEFDAIRGGPGALDVSATTPDGREVLARELVPVDAPVKVELPSASAGSQGQQLLRISFVAHRAVAEPPGEIVLVRPQLRARSQDVKAPGVLPNIIVYLPDTLRRDHLGVYGYDRPVSPRLDAFAKHSVVFENAIAPAPWTTPSLVSLFTGMNPRRHGVTGLFDSMPEQAVSLAEVLRARGYETVCLTANAHMSAAFGLDQGFSRFVELRRSARNAGEIHAGHSGWEHQHSELDLIHELALEWLEQRDAQKPFFLFLHTMDPHSPYRPSEPFWESFAPAVSPSDRAAYADIMEIEQAGVTPDVLDALRDLYDGEIAGNDARFGVLLDDLAARDLYDDSLIVFLSDHGEAFYERGHLGHGNDLHSETQRIPLVVKVPGRSGGRVATPVSLVDVFETLLDVLQIELPGERDGRSLEPALGGGDSTGGAVAARPVFAHLDAGAPLADSVIDGAWKLIHSRDSAGSESFELYHRRNDPEETTDVADRHPEVRRRLGALLKEQESQRPSWEVERGDVDELLLLRLEALGYAE